MGKCQGVGLQTFELNCICNIWWFAFICQVGVSWGSRCRVAKQPICQVAWHDFVNSSYWQDISIQETCQPSALTEHCHRHHLSLPCGKRRRCGARKYGHIISSHAIITSSDVLHMTIILFTTHGSLLRWNTLLFFFIILLIVDYGAHNWPFVC